MHEGMGYLQVGLIDSKVVVKQDVDIDGTIFIEVRGER